MTDKKIAGSLPAMLILLVDAAQQLVNTNFTARLGVNFLNDDRTVQAGSL